MEFTTESIVLNSENKSVNKNVIESIKTYARILLDYNQKVNLISRQITPEGLSQLLNESILLNSYISLDFIIDAGSGNGILGIPIALMNENKKIILAETQGKKIFFLQYLVDQMKLENVEVEGVSIEEYVKTAGKGKKSIISRGFPNIGAFCMFLKRHLIDDAILITSENKIKNYLKDMESLSKKTYNVPLRDELKILKLWRS
jgi:16S rRNA G527 N7-methylase RsmG